MIITRHIRENEAAQFFEILCAAFDLYRDAAAPIFYQDPNYDLKRKWALFDNGQMVSILTTTPIAMSNEKGIGIAGVATAEHARHSGYAQRLIEATIRSAENSQENFALLFATNPKLYLNSGFEPLDEVVEGPIITQKDPKTDTEEAISFDQVKEIYTRWQTQYPNTIVRNPKRWSSWRYHPRPCFADQDGYFCYEADHIREAPFQISRSAWPVVEGSIWSGLRSVTQFLDVPLVSQKSTGLMLMGRNISVPPLMFMTDQF